MDGIVVCLIGDIDVLCVVSGLMACSKTSIANEGVDVDMQIPA